MHLVDAHSHHDAPSHHDFPMRAQIARAHSAGGSLAWPPSLSTASCGLLLRMFRDPRVLEAAERRELIAQLRNAAESQPHIPEVRVLLGMALCVDLQAQEALEQFRHATRQAPGSFIAHLKLGELLMRLRICDQAAEETHKAAQLAVNAAQSDLARRQAAQIRAMVREGIERGGYRNLLARLLPSRRKARAAESTPLLAPSR